MQYKDKVMKIYDVVLLYYDGYVVCPHYAPTDRMREIFPPFALEISVVNDCVRQQ